MQTFTYPSAETVLTKFTDSGDIAELTEENDGWLAHCPAHSDSNPSLRLALMPDSGGRGHNLVVKCRAGCQTEQVLTEAGVEWEDLFGLDPAGLTIAKAHATRLPDGDDRIALSVGVEIAAQMIDQQARDFASTEYGLTDAQIKEYRLGVLGTGAMLPPKPRELLGHLARTPRLVVPFMDQDGNTINAQARAMDPETPKELRWLSARSAESGTWSRWGCWNIDSEGVVVFAEGVSDGLVVAGTGTPVVFHAGASIAPQTARAIFRRLEGRSFVVIGDGDRAGEAFANTVVSAARSTGVAVYRIDVPTGTDLRDQYLAEPSRFAEWLSDSIEAARMTGDEWVRRADELRLFEFDSHDDKGNATRFLEYLRRNGVEEIRWVQEAGKWAVCTEGRWTLDTSGEITKAASRFQDAVLGVVSDPQSTDGLTEKQVTMLGAWRRTLRSTRGRDAFLVALRDHEGAGQVSVLDFDSDPDLIGVGNGVVDLRSGTLMPYTADRLILKRVPIDYDPEAGAPRWERFLDECHPAHTDTPDYLRRLIGYGLTGHTSEQMFVVFLGTGSNGKSVFINTIETVLGAEVVTTTPFGTFEKRQNGSPSNDLAKLKGARIVLASEGDRTSSMDEATLKRATGQDTLSARFLHHEFFEFRPSFLLLLSTNHEPKFHSQDEGLWRRVKLVGWHRFFAEEERDRELGDWLVRHEAEGILAWAIRGAVEWYAEGKRQDEETSVGRLIEPDSIREATRAYRQDADDLFGFLPGWYVLDPEASPLKGSDVYAEYEEWARTNGEPDPWKAKGFYSALKTRGVVARRTKLGVTLFGMRRTEVAEEAKAERDARFVLRKPQ